MLKQAVILAGGLGTRLGPLTRDTPKPLLPVGDVPFLEHVVWNLKRFGIERFLFSVGYRAEKIMAHFGNGRRLGVQIEYVFEKTPAGTGGALVLARQLGRLDEWFLVANGDTLFDINFLDLSVLTQSQNALAGLALRQIPDASRYGRVRLNGVRITGFDEKSGKGPGLINGGVYAMHRNALEHLPPGPSSLERDLFPKLAAHGKLVGRVYSGFFIDIGVPEALQAAQVLVPRWRQRPAVLLDRDGVLNKDLGHVHRPEEFTWMPGAPEAVKWLNDQGYLVIVVTNQSGIARGYYTEEAFQDFSAWINKELNKIGAHLDATYYCPHHPTEGYGPYLRACDCRKPAPGMIRRAIRDWGIDVPRSLLVGDQETDLLAAQAAGVHAALYYGGPLLPFVQRTLAALTVHQPTPAPQKERRP